MIDHTLCTDSKCPLSKRCRRFNHDKKGINSFFLFSPNLKGEDSCSEFVPLIKTKEKEKIRPDKSGYWLIKLDNKLKIVEVLVEGCGIFIILGYSLMEINDFEKQKNVNEWFGKMNLKKIKRQIRRENSK